MGACPFLERVVYPSDEGADLHLVGQRETSNSRSQRCCLCGVIPSSRTQLVKDYDRQVHTSEAWIYVAMSRIMLSKVLAKACDVIAPTLSKSHIFPGDVQKGMCPFRRGLCTTLCSLASCSQTVKGFLILT